MSTYDSSAPKKKSVSNQIVVEAITIRHIKMDLRVPYRLSYRTFEVFEPYVVEITGSDGTKAWGDGHISPGSSRETREGGWAFCNKIAPELLGRTADEAVRFVSEKMSESKVAGSALCVALEMLQGSSLLNVEKEIVFPLITPLNAVDPSGIETEVEQKLDQGFRTFKVKVGKDVQADLKRLSDIQNVLKQRATLRVDANRGYNREEGILFASSISPSSIQLFEQPCPSEDWESNAAVAAVSNVPLMLDEPICSMDDIDRAADIKGVGFCKLKLKRFGTLNGLYTALNHVRELGMEPTLGDGLGSELTSWMEACVAQTTIRNAGEFNGFLKPRERLFSNALEFKNGNLILPRGYQPHIDEKQLDKFTEKVATFAS
jgi:L-Ala-D/L-Glu epimerase